MRASLPALAIGVGLSASPTSPASGWRDAFAAEDAQAPYTVIESGAKVIELDQQVGDLLLVDAEADLRGVVRGHVYAVDSEVVVRSTAVVLKSMTVLRGSLRVEMGAVLPESIALTDARIVGPNGGALAPRSGDRIQLGRAGTTISLSHTKLSTAAVRLMKSVLLFDRFSPSGDMTLGDLAAWDPGLGLALKKDLAHPKELVVGGVTRLSFVSTKVKGAFQRGYKGARGTVLISAIQLKDEEASRALWAEIERVVPESKVALSIRTALGDGAHWYFRHKRRYSMFWRQGPWFFAVETKLGPSQVTVDQEKQFSDQVLSRLRIELAARKFERRATHASGVMR